MRGLGFLRRVGSCAARLTTCARIDGALCAELIAWRISLPFLKRVLGMRTLARLMWSPPASGDYRDPRDRIASARYLFKTGGRLLVSPNCLERSLVMYKLFSRAAVGPTLVLGARRDGASLAAHAWVELDGKPLDDPDVDQYVRLVAFGRRGRRHETLETPGRGQVA
jgi:hypothetical protein